MHRLTSSQSPQPNWTNCTTNYAPILHILRVWLLGEYFLFPNIKRSLAGKNYGSNEELIAAVEEYFAGQEKSYYIEGLITVQQRGESVSS